MEEDAATDCRWKFTLIVTPCLNLIWTVQIIWGTISFILSLSGNVFVLYATIVHSAIKLDKMSVWIIKNLAVADICNCVLVLLPIILTQYGKLNNIVVFGETFYTVMGCYVYAFFVANIYLVNFLSVNKLMRCMFPLRNLDSSRRKRLIVTIVTALASFIPVIWFISGLVDDVHYLSEYWTTRDYKGAIEVCSLYYDHCKFSSHREIIYLVSLVICNGLPCVTLIVFNFALLAFAMKKSNSSLKKKGIAMVLIVTATFLLSFMPTFLALAPILKSLGNREIAFSAVYLSIWNNPFVYLATNTRFKDFVIRKLFPWKKRSQVEPFSSHMTCRNND